MSFSVKKSEYVDEMRAMLNDEQYAVVNSDANSLLVTAGAGSGKTRTLIYRIAYLVHVLDTSPYSILAVTFTNKAAGELKDRLGKSPLNVSIADANAIWVSTFHSMCVRMLRRFGDHLGFSKNFSIYAEKEKENLVRRIVKDKYNDDNNDKDEAKLIINAISDAKNHGLNPDDYKKEYEYINNVNKIHAVFVEYEEQKQKNNALDFDDLLVQTRRMLLDCKEARNYYQEKFKYILVDEFQDTNTIQYDIVKILAAKHRNAMMVGDEDQSIYSWRGASLTNLQSFVNDFSPKQYKLEQNYRSTKNILEVANKLIVNNSARLDKKLWTLNADGADIITHIANDEYSEAEFVMQKVVNLKRVHNLQNSDFAILMRVNALTRSFEEKCIQYGIPYRITGGFKFYERKEIKDILAYLRIAANPQDSEAILRVINFPKRGIGDSAVSQLLNYAVVSFDSLHGIIKNIEKNDDLPKALVKKIAPFSAVLKRIDEAATKLDVAKLTRFIIDLLDLKTVFVDDTDENENRKQNIKELVGGMESFVKQNPNSSVVDYLQTVSLYSDTDELDANDDRLNITTIHSAKGLEFKNVFIIGLEDGLLPIARSVDNQSELEEERRLLYVAITRAEERLFLTYAASRFLHGQRKPSLPSRFLKELGYQMKSYQAINSYQNEYSGYKKYTTNSVYADKYADKVKDGQHGGYGNFRPQNTIFNRQNSQISLTMPDITNKMNVSTYKNGTVVEHARFGKGTIVSISGSDDIVYGEINFELVGKMNLSLNHAPLKIIKE